MYACVVRIPLDVGQEKLVGTKVNPRCINCHRSLKRATTSGKWPSMRHKGTCPVAVPGAHNDAVPVALASTAQPSRKRRAASDPGEQPTATRTITRRVAPPKPVTVQKQPRIARSHEEVMRLLDETVARRMAYEAAQAGTAQQ